MDSYHESKESSKLCENITNSGGYNTYSNKNKNYNSDSKKQHEQIKKNNDIRDQDLEMSVSSQKELLKTNTNSTSGKGILSMPRRSLFILFLCTLANFLTGCAFSLLAPFFPLEAKTKGMSQPLVGAVFSVYELVIFLACPLIGTFLTDIGAKFTHISSVFCGGTTTVIFGTLYYCPPGTAFAVLAFFCRSLQAIGFAGFIIASFSIVCSEFSDRVVTVFGVIETGTMVGYMSGPIIGGVLYDIGGFGLPFYVLGGVIIINGAALFGFLPSPKENNPARKGSILRLFTNAMFVVPLVSIFVGAIVFTALQPTLADHLQPFGLSSTVIGLIFFVQPFSSCIAGPIFGHLSDTLGIQAPLIVIGHFLLALGFFMIGPAIPFLPLEIWTVVISLVLIGGAYECTLIPTAKCMVIGALEVGFQDDIATYGVISGVLNSVYYLGGAVGPLVGVAFSFNNGTAVVGLMNLFVMVLCLVFFTNRAIKSRHNIISIVESRCSN